MTSPTATPPHQDPAQHDDISKVTMLEYTTTLISTLDRRFDTLHQDLKDSIRDRFAAVEKAAADADLRYQQRYDAQQIALKDALIGADKAVQAALTAADRAVAKAETASEKRFDSVNEFRGQLADQAHTFMPRSEAENRLAALSEKVDDLKAFRDANVGRESAVPNSETQIQRLVEEVRGLRDYRESTQGKAQGSQLSIGWIISALGVVGTLVVIVNIVIALVTK